MYFWLPPDFGGGAAPRPPWLRPCSMLYIDNLFQLPVSSDYRFLIPSPLKFVGLPTKTIPLRAPLSTGLKPSAPKSATARQTSNSRNTASPTA